MSSDAKPRQQTGNGDRESPSADKTVDGNSTSQASSKIDESSAPSSPNKSSAKSTPTKSRNKRKSEAKKRNQAKKQAATMESSNENQLQSSDSQSHDCPEKSAPQADEQTALGSQQEPVEADSLITAGEPKSPTPPSPLPMVQQAPTPLQQQQEQPPKQNHLANAECTGGNINNRSTHDSNSWRRRQREIRELKEQLKVRDNHLQTFSERTRQQMIKIRELETSLISTTRTCKQFENLLQQELSAKNRLESENEILNQTVNRLKAQLNVHEKNKLASDELIRVLNATLMERETEVSILKLKMTCLQTNPAMSLNGASSISSIKQQKPAKTLAMAERSNSEFCRNSYVRSSMVAEAASVRSSTGQLQSNDRDASIWAQVPLELTPSKRPLLLERNFQPIYSDSHYDSLINNESSTPIMRDRRYKTLPRSMKSPPLQELSKPDTSQKQEPKSSLSSDDPQTSQQKEPTYCLITNLDDSNSTNQSVSGNKTTDNQASPRQSEVDQEKTKSEINLSGPARAETQSHQASVQKEVADINDIHNPKQTNADRVKSASGKIAGSPSHSARGPSTPSKTSSGLLKILGKIMRSDSSSSSNSKNDLSKTASSSSTSAFQRGATRSTLVGPPSNIRAQLTPIRRAADFKTDKPFADWDTDLLVDWLTMMGLSMYAPQCRRWVRCGAHIMNATPAEVDKGLGITNHLHRKKLRLAISELNGDCDKITKAAAKLDYLWVARWLDDIGLPQHKEAFINGRVDGRVLNYLTVEDLVSMGIKSVLHHSSIRCGIRVLRSIGFDLQSLKRRATAEEIEQMSSMRQRMETDETHNLSPRKNVDPHKAMELEGEISLWTCHRVMEWLRMIDFAEFAPNLRGSGVHGGLIMFEDGFTIDTLCSILSIPTSRTLLRRHLSSFFEVLIGGDLAQRKRQCKESPSRQQINPSAEIKTPKKSPLWFSKLKGSKVGQDGMDDYLCPMYPVEPQILKSSGNNKNNEFGHRDGSNLPRIPESINV